MHITINADLRKEVKYETKVCINVPLAEGRQDAGWALDRAAASLADGKLAKLVDQAIESAGFESHAWDIGSIKLQVELEGRQLMKPDRKFQIATFTRNGVVHLDVEATDKVERVKEKIEEKEGISPPQQRLIFAGKQLSDEKTLAEYGVKAGDVIYMVMALRGC